MIATLETPMTRIERIGLVTAWVLAAALMWPLRAYLTDDTFIHLQYARHLAGGQGLVFNLGERVYGCTSPLWVALVADGMALGLDGLVVARALGVISTLVSVAFFLQLVRRLLRTPELRALATVTWACNAWMLRWSVSGMETPLAVALTLAGFVAFTEGKHWGSRPVRTGALWALAALTRPELVFLLLIWCVALIADAQNRSGLRRLVFGMLPPAAIYGTWLAFSRVYFGTFWPLTLSAKAAGGGGLADVAGWWRVARIVGATDGVLLVVLLMCLIVGGRRLWHGGGSAHRLLPWVWVVALPMLYLARGIPVVSRYLLVILPIAAALAWRALESLWLGLETTSRRPGVIVAGGLIAAIVIAQNLTVYRSAVLPQVISFTQGLNRSLVTWGTWFERHAPPRSTIATPDIGAIGYFSHARIFDLAGLVTPRMVPLIEREPWEDALAQFHFASFARPTFVVDRAREAYDLLKRSPYAACLTPLGQATVPNLGIAIPGEVVYTFYRVDWTVFDRMRSAR